jgi:hypothetical protein
VRRHAVDFGGSAADLPADEDRSVEKLPAFVG